MSLRELQDTIQTLVHVAESDEPVVNCYLNLDNHYHHELREGVDLLKEKIEPQMRVPFWEAMGRIEVFLGTQIRPGARSTAIFSRGGNHPFFLPLQFETGLPDSVTVSSAPHTYNLIALRHDKIHTPASRLEQEAHVAAIRARMEMRADKHAASGTFDCYRALITGCAATLVLARNYAPLPCWVCDACKAMWIQYPAPGPCYACKSNRLKEIDIKEEMIRIAERTHCSIRLVEPGESITARGGVGCLLRQRESGRLDRPAA